MLRWKYVVELLLGNPIPTRCILDKVLLHEYQLVFDAYISTPPFTVPKESFILILPDAKTVARILLITAFV